MLIGLLCLVSACSDDDAGEQYLKTNSITVVKSNVSFSAAAGEGQVVVTAPGAITATLADSSWAKATVDGSTVNVSVKANASEDARNTMLTIRNGEDSVQVNVLQIGNIYQTTIPDYIAFGSNKKDSVYYVIDHSQPVTIVSTPSWAEATLNGDTLKVKVSEKAASDPMRIGDIVLENAGVKNSYKVVQYDLASDIEGSYTLSGTDADGNAISYDVTYENNALKLKDYNITLPITFDSSEMSFTTTVNNSYIGKADLKGASRLYYLELVDAEGTTYKVYTDNAIAAPLNLSASPLTASFAGELKSKAFTAFRFTAYRIKNNIDRWHMKDYDVVINNPVLTKK